MALFIGHQLYPGEDSRNVIYTANEHTLWLKNNVAETIDLTGEVGAGIMRVCIDNECYPNYLYAGIFVANVAYPQVQVSMGKITLYPHWFFPGTSRIWLPSDYLSNARYSIYGFSVSGSIVPIKGVIFCPPNYSNHCYTNIDLGATEFELPINDHVTIFDNTITTCWGHSLHVVLQTNEVVGESRNIFGRTYYGYPPKLQIQYYQRIEDEGCTYEYYNDYTVYLFLTLYENKFTNIPIPDDSPQKRYIAFLSPDQQHLWYWKAMKLFIRYPGSDPNSGVEISMKDLPVGEFSYLGEFPVAFGINLYPDPEETAMTCNFLRTTLITPDNEVFASWEREME